MTDPSLLSVTVAQALAEDLGFGDVTSEATVAPKQRARARITQGAPGAVYGLEVVGAGVPHARAGHQVFRTLEADITLTRLGPEGEFRNHGPAVEGYPGDPQTGAWVIDRAGTGHTARFGCVLDDVAAPGEPPTVGTGLVSLVIRRSR